MRPLRAKGFWWAAVIAGILCGITSGALLSLTRDLPQIQSLENFRPSSVTRVFSADNVLLAELFLEKRDPVSVSQIPNHLISALLTIEDRRFYTHSGLDLKSLLRAILKNLRKGRYAEGASTLTQQLAKTLFLTPRKTLVRKLREAILAIQLERRYTKDEILALYLNQIYLGSGAYGINAAARTYFDKSLQELSLSQCALIAGLPKAPSRLSPFINPDLARKRRDLVLAQMHASGVIDKKTYIQARQEPVGTVDQESSNNKAPHFVDYIIDALEGTIGADQLYKSGLTVHTTLSYQQQLWAEQAVSSGLGLLETRMAQIKKAPPLQPEAALVSLNINTGGIVAMVGGRDINNSGYNRATKAKRQPGSAFKPLIYALALERGFDQHHTLLDAPVVFQTGRNGLDWQPQNFSETYDGEITLRWALAHSKNIPAVRLLEKLGPSSVIQFGYDLGLDSDLQANLSLALGTSEINLLELTAVYAAFANQGKHIQPYGVTQVTDDRGTLLWQARPEQHLALSRTSAAIITDMLTAVIDSGTGRRARTMTGPLAGKTGTTNKAKDALFVGYSPTISTGVWVGNDDASSLGPGETGARTALPIWMAFMRQALTQYRPHYFDIPDEVHAIYIHPRTGERMPVNHTEAVRVLVRKNNPE